MGANDSGISINTSLRNVQCQKFPAKDVDVRCIYITVAFTIPVLNVCLQQVQLKIEKLISHLGYEADHTVNDAIHKRGASVALAQPHIMVAAQNVVRSGSSPGPTNDPGLRSSPFQRS